MSLHAPKRGLQAIFGTKIVVEGNTGRGQRGHGVSLLHGSASCSESCCERNVVRARRVGSFTMHVVRAACGTHAGP